MIISVTVYSRTYFNKEILVYEKYSSYMYSSFIEI